VTAGYGGGLALTLSGLAAERLSLELVETAGNGLEWRPKENVRLAECPSQGVPITAYARSSSGAEDCRQLAAEVIAQEGKAS
jgi:chromosome partitioning protein